MGAIGTVIGAVVGVVVGIAAGMWVGKQLRDFSYAWYWVANGVALIIGVAGNTVGLMYSQWWLVVGSLAFTGGALTGLKYGLGRSVGLWRVHDDLVGNDDLPKD